VPVPVSVRIAGQAPDGVSAFNEMDCLRGGLGAMKSDGLMRVLLA
jgi:2,3-bisphosphoglycerate-independent phosphoglycerate mutase